MNLENRLVRKLLRQMNKMGFEFCESIIADGLRHFCKAYKNGRFYKMFWYQATKDPLSLGDNSLVCSFGFVDEIDQHHYSSYTKAQQI